MTNKQFHGLYMHFHGHTIVLSAIQALSRPLQQSEGPNKSLSKIERKNAFRDLEDDFRVPESANRG